MDEEGIIVGAEEEVPTPASVEGGEAIPEEVTPPTDEPLPAPPGARGPGLRLKQRVKAGELTTEDAIEILKGVGGEGSSTWGWLQRRKKAGGR